MTEVLLIGCGRMGGALLKGWRDSGVVERATVIDPAMPSVPGATVLASLSDTAGPLPGTILLAVKPQMLDSVLPPLRDRLPKAALVISIAAGKTLSYFADRLGPSLAVVRTMPNMPAAIGRGMTVCCAGPTVGQAGRAITGRLLSAVGEVAWIENEALMHAVTAVSGSGPAYVFLLIEALQAAAEAAGLPADLAALLARQTVVGAGEMARRSVEAPARLRADVTSPAGTTAAALAVLMGDAGLPALMNRAVAAATARSEELAEG